jgi:hypothetical protein
MDVCRCGDGSGDLDQSSRIRALAFVIVIGMKCGDMKAVCHKDGGIKEREEGDCFFQTRIVQCLGSFFLIHRVQNQPRPLLL